MSLPVKEGGRELLRVEVLEARADGTAKFRLWYHKWRDTRPGKPYVDFEVRPYQDRDGRIRFIGLVYASKRKGIYREHLAEIAKVLEREGVKGVSLRSDGYVLRFTGAFRDSVLARLGIKPELPLGEPPAVQHLGGLKFKIGDREVEFGRGYVKGGYEFYAVLKMPSAEEAVYFAASLRAVGVDAKVVGNVIRLDSDSFFGLLAATNAVPPGLTPLYRSKDLHVYAGVEKGRVRYYFAVRHKGVWRAAEGLYKKRSVELKRAEREVLEAIRSVVARALETLSRPAEVGEPKEVRGEEGNVKAHYLPLYGYHVVPFLEHAAEGVETELAEVRLEGRRIAVKAGGVEAAVEFKLLKRNETVFLLTQDVAQTLALYKSLKALGAPVEITPKGVGINSEVLWTLVAVAVERSALGGLPAEIMPGVKLLRVYNAGGMHIYIFRVSEEGTHYYFVVKTRQGWRAAGGKQSGRQVQINGEAAHAVADAINAVCREMGVDRKIEVRYGKDGVSRIKLTNVDLELLGVK